MDKNVEYWELTAESFDSPLCHFCPSVEDSADLDSIEAVANEVLNMEMPSTPEQLQALTEDIRERVESLSDVEVILQQSAGDIARAEMLLEEAKKARYATSFCIRYLQSLRTGMRLPFHSTRECSLPYHKADTPFLHYQAKIALCSVWPLQSKSTFIANLVLLHSKGATDVKVTADMVKAALEEAEKAQDAAEKAIKQADEDIKGTQDLLTSVSYFQVLFKMQKQEYIWYSETNIRMSEEGYT